MAAAFTAAAIATAVEKTATAASVAEVEAADEALAAVGEEMGAVKAMAAAARAAWKALKHQIGDQLWLRHVVKPGEHQWARGANVLAGRGKQGTRTQVEHMRR